MTTAQQSEATWKKLIESLSEPSLTGSVPRDKIPAVMAALAAAQTQLSARLLAAPAPKATERLEDDRLLTAEEAAPVLGITPHWLYRHANQLPFARRLSRKVLRFSESGLKKYVSIKRA